MKNIQRVQSLHHIPLKYLQDWIILDLDNTLVEPEKDAFLEDAKEFLERLNPAKVLIITNSPRDLSWIKSQIHFSIYRGRKPFLGIWKKVSSKHGIKKENVVIIGDRLFTDGFFGKRIGAKTILISPQSKNEFFLIKWSRILENLLLR